MPIKAEIIQTVACVGDMARARRQQNRVKNISKPEMLFLWKVTVGLWDYGYGVSCMFQVAMFSLKRVWVIREVSHHFPRLPNVEVGKSHQKTSFSFLRAVGPTQLTWYRAAVWWVSLSKQTKRWSQFQTRWWFEICFIFTPTWGIDPIWLTFVKWAETTNHQTKLQIWHVFFVTPTRWSVNLSDSRGGKSSSPPPWSLTVSFPRNFCHPQLGIVVFQPPFFRGELLNFRGASMSSHFQMVVSFIFYFHPYLGKIPILASIFFQGVEITN